MSGSNSFTYLPDELEAGDRYTPFRNSRLIPFLRDNKYDDSMSWDIIEYNENIQDVDLQNDLEQENDMYQYQTIAGDLLIDGAFNVNSTRRCGLPILVHSGESRFLK